MANENQMSEPHRRLLDEPIANAKGDRLKFFSAQQCTSKRN